MALIDVTELADLTKEANGLVTLLQSNHIKSVAGMHLTFLVFTVNVNLEWISNKRLEIYFVKPTYAMLIHYARFGKMRLEYRPRHRRTYQEGASLSVSPSWNTHYLELNQLGITGKKLPRGISTGLPILDIALFFFVETYLYIDETAFPVRGIMITPKLLPQLLL